MCVCFNKYIYTHIERGIHIFFTCVNIFINTRSPHLGNTNVNKVLEFLVMIQTIGDFEVCLIK